MGFIYGIDVLLHTSTRSSFFFTLFLITLTLLEFVNASLRSNYDNCLQDSAIFIKLNLLRAMM